MESRIELNVPDRDFRALSCDPEAFQGLQAADFEIFPIGEVPMGNQESVARSTSRECITGILNIVDSGHISPEEFKDQKEKAYKALTASSKLKNGGPCGRCMAGISGNCSVANGYVHVGIGITSVALTQQGFEDLIGLGVDEDGEPPVVEFDVDVADADHGIGPAEIFDWLFAQVQGYHLEPASAMNSHNRRMKRIARTYVDMWAEGQIQQLYNGERVIVSGTPEQPLLRL